MFKLIQLCFVYFLYFCDEFFHFVLVFHEFKPVLGFEIINLNKIFVAISMFVVLASINANSGVEVAFEVGGKEDVGMEAGRI